MNQPEYILEESGKTLLTGKQLAFIVQQLLDMEVDSRVLRVQLIKLADFSTRIETSLRESRLSLQEQELPD